MKFTKLMCHDDSCFYISKTTRWILKLQARNQRAKMKEKQESLSDQILALSNPTPTDGPDDFWDEDTTAKVAEFDEDNEDPAKTSLLRKKTAHRNFEEDSRYKGLKTSRKNWSSSGKEEDDDTNEEDFVDDDDEDEEDEEEDDDDDYTAEKIKEMTRKLKGRIQNLDEDESMDDDDQEEEEDDDEEDNDDEDDEYEDDDIIAQKISAISRKMKGQGRDEESSEEDVSKEDDSDDDIDDDLSFDDDSEEDDDDEEGDEDDDDDEEEEDVGIEGFSQVNASEEVEKGKAVQSQLGLWDSFMENRIKLQKALHISNQLPQCQMLDRFMEEEDDGELQVVLKKSEKELVRLMQSLISLQDALLQQNPETQHILHGETPGNQSTNSDAADDDEEIPSDTDDEGEDDKSKTIPAPEMERTSRKRKLDPSEFGEHLAKHHKNFESYRNNTIQKWYEKTRLSTGKLNKKSFSGFERSALLQIQQILQDQSRLVQRTQLKRSGFTVLGQRSKDSEKRVEEDEDGDMQDIPEKANQHLKNYDPEIFDDDDFYHQLLRELIERRTSSTSDPVQLTRQWLQVQKLRTKVKRQVDTKASKGRKLRYDIHQKLVSFMAPEDSSPMLPEARAELFKSIFGQSIAAEETGR